MTDYVSLADVSKQISLSADELSLLQSAGVRTADGAHNLLTASLKGSDAQFPAMDVGRRRAVAEALVPLRSAAYAKADQYVAYPRGAAAPSAAANSFALKSNVAQKQAGLQGLPAVDLVKGRYANWPILHEQGSRQACVAFAVVSCLELLRAGQGTTFVSLSPQFLYWYMRTSLWPPPLPPGWTDGATKLGQANGVLATRGICRWEKSPYDTDAHPLEGPEPSDEAKAEGAANRVTSGLYQPQHTPGIARKIYDDLSQGRPVAIAVPVYCPADGSSATNWSSGITSGEVIDPYSDGVLSGGHAVCVVAFQPDPAESGGGWFIFRNSVGLNWASGFQPAGDPPRVPARGYGAISATYVEGFCWEFLSLAA
jgi:hypothetical protein